MLIVLLPAPVLVLDDALATSEAAVAVPDAFDDEVATALEAVVEAETTPELDTGIIDVKCSLTSLVTAVGAAREMVCVPATVVRVKVSERAATGGLSAGERLKTDHTERSRGRCS